MAAVVMGGMFACAAFATVHPVKVTPVRQEKM